MLSGRDREPLPGAAAGMAGPHLPGGCRIGDVPAAAPVSYQGRPGRGKATVPGAAIPGPGPAGPRNADVSLRGIPGPGTGRDRV